ncbi:MAG: peptidase S41, partial [Flavisolibacter sp.]
MSLKFLCALLLLADFSAYAQNDPLWLRYPSISPDGKTIVFTYKGDLYKIPSSGGNAVSLTQNEAHDFMPVWSHDGKTIAFASDRYGNFDIFTIPVSGGEAKRLTYHSANEYPYDFSPDDKTIYFGASRIDAASNRQFPASYMPELYSVSINGGRVFQVLTTPAEDIKWNKAGTVMLYHDKKGGENPWRKHHVSSIARDIWMYDAKTGTHTKITNFAGEDRSPVFTDNEQAIYYLSEASGSFNVYKMNLGDKKPSQVTSFNTHPVRFLSIAGDGTICFSYNGELYTKKPGSDAQKLHVVISTEGQTNNERIVNISGGVRDLAVSPNGKEVAFIYRGEVFVSSVDGGTTKRITNTPEQERNVNFSPDGRSLLYSSERGKGWKIYQAEISRKEEPYFFASTIIKETPVIDNDKENYEPEFSPDGKEIAFVEDRNILKVYNLATKQVRTLLATNELFSMSDNDQYFTWSPDSKWILFEFTEPGFANDEVGIIASDGKSKKINLTESGYRDYAPQWMMGGKMMIWNSTREGLRAQANSGGAQADVYAMFFTQDAYDRFKLNREDFSLLKESEDKAAKSDSLKKINKKDTVLIDWEGLKDRKARITLHSSSLSDALVS